MLELSMLMLVSHELQLVALGKNCTVECVTQCYKNAECAQGYNLGCGLLGCILTFSNSVWFYFIRRHFKSFSSIH